MKSFRDYLGLSNSCSYDVDDVIGRADRFGFQNFCSPVSQYDEPTAKLLFYQVASACKVGEWFDKVVSISQDDEPTAKLLFYQMASACKVGELFDQVVSISQYDEPTAKLLFYLMASACKVGELFDKVVSISQYDEPTAKLLFYQMASACKVGGFDIFGTLYSKISRTVKSQVGWLVVLENLQNKFGAFLSQLSLNMVLI